MEKLNRHEVKSLTKKSEAVVFKSTMLKSDSLFFTAVFFIVVISSILIFSKDKKNVLMFSILIIINVLMIIASYLVRRKIPITALVYYNGKMIFHVRNGIYYAITPSELISYNISPLPSLFKSKDMQIDGTLSLTCECGEFNSLYVFKINKLNYCMEAFQQGFNVYKETKYYNQTYMEEAYKYIAPMILSIGIIFGLIYFYDVASPWNIVSMIAFPLAGLISFFYFLNKILKIRKKYK